MLEAMVCHSLGHRWKTVPIGKITPTQIKRFQSPRALAALYEMRFDMTRTQRRVEITYCGRCFHWDINKTLDQNNQNTT